MGKVGSTSPTCKIYQGGNRAYRHGGREYRTIGAIDESEERQIFLLVVTVGVAVVVRKAEERQIWEVAVSVGNQDLSRRRFRRHLRCTNTLLSSPASGDSRKRGVRVSFAPYGRPNSSSPASSMAASPRLRALAFCLYCTGLKVALEKRPNRAFPAGLAGG